MADEQTVSATETPAQANTEASIGAKLQKSTTGKALDSATTEQPKTSQAANPDAEKKVDSDKTQKTEKQPEAVKPAWDETHANWAQSKGIDLAAYDPSNESHKKTIQNAYNAESEMNRAKNELQQIKNQSKAKEIAELSSKVPNPNQPASPEQPKTKIQEYEDSYKIVLDNILYLNGADSLESLREVNPQAAAKYESTYLKGRQIAWEEEQTRLQQEGKKQQQQEMAKIRFNDEMSQAKTAMEKNLLSLKQNNPDLDKHLEKSGANEILKYFESEPIYWPKEFIMSNPKLANWFSKAARAIDLMENFEGEKSKLRQEWEKDLIKKKEAELVPADGGKDSVEAKVFSRMQSRKGGPL